MNNKKGYLPKLNTSVGDSFILLQVMKNVFDMMENILEKSFFLTVLTSLCSNI